MLDFLNVEYHMDMSPFSPAVRDRAIVKRKRKEAQQRKWTEEREVREELRRTQKAEQEKMERLEREANWAQIVYDRDNISMEAESRYQSYMKKAREDRERKTLEKKNRLKDIAAQAYAESNEAYLEATRRTAELWFGPGPSVIEMYKKKGVSPEKLQERLNELVKNKMDKQNEH